MKEISLIIVDLVVKVKDVVQIIKELKVLIIKV